MTYEEKLPYYIESICKALSIKNEQELNQLLSLFDRNNLAEKEEIKFSEESNSESFDDGNKIKTERGNKLEIDPDTVLKLLRDFFDEKKKKSREQSNIYPI
jgi:hypothetical protein